MNFYDPAYLDAQYRRWKENPDGLTQDWQFFFQGFELAFARSPGEPALDEDQIRLQSRVEALIYRYRDLGHLLACLDPLTACPTDHPLLNLAEFQLDGKDLDTPVYTDTFSATHKIPLRDVVAALKETYCRSVGVEYMHLQDPFERRWLQERMEPNRNRATLDDSARIRILEKLLQAGLFEQVLHKKYLGQTRFSLEGAEAVIPMLDSLLEKAAEGGCREVILGMAHRGRLNVQAHILNKPYADLFSEFESCYDPDQLEGAGDVKYHNGYLAEVETAGGRKHRVYLVSNPSHLESVNPVVEGLARARQEISADGTPAAVMPVLIHGDAAFAGQGIVSETLNLSQLQGYSTGGTVHIIINNQIGYTTFPEDARSTRYATDVAKMLMVPIFHVHGEDPETLVHVIRLACDYRNTFAKDIVIDLVCYRRYGHNEGDEPYFTQPQMYARIKDRPPLNGLYTQKLLDEKVVDQAAVDTMEDRITRSLETAYESVHGSACPFPVYPFYENWDGLDRPYTPDPVKTGVAQKQLVSLARKLRKLPDGFHLHPKLKRILDARLETAEKGKGIDWANAEALAFASLLSEGFPIRLSGQDVGRGTFSQRHCALVDMETGKRHLPLQALAGDGAAFAVYDSMLSEAGVLGFEYGFSLAQPRGLVIWEAQFGDFANNAQSIIDLYIASGETKWGRPSGIVLLLPHGMEGLGPEHSSARMERFLQLCADDNMQLCNATTPGQYFHLLRRQVKRNFRKPLVIFTPKSLLRHPLAVSPIQELAAGTFQEVLEDPDQPKSPRRLLFCSGKIFYDLAERRRELKAAGIGIVRIEQLYPVPGEQLEQVVKRLGKGAKNWCWVQEEPENMGAWRFMRPILEAVIGGPLDYVGRKPSPSPATGFPGIYQRERAEILEKAVGPAPKQK